MNNELHEKVAGILTKQALKEKEPPIEYQFSDLSDEQIQTVTTYQNLKIGIRNIDKGGLPTGMNLIAGQSGAGKSWFLNHLVKVAWELNKKKSVVFSLEMDFEGLKKRMLQSYSGLTYEDFIYNGDTSKGIKFLKEANPLIVDYTQSDEKNITVESFLERVHDLYKAGYRVFMFDHFHEIPGASVNDKNQQVTEKWAGAFKLLRNTYDDIWLFILVQVNKAGYKKKVITKEDISGSSALVNKCDLILTLNRTEDPEKDIDVGLTQEKNIKIWIDKSRRNGFDKYISWVTLKGTGEFVDTADNQADSFTKDEQPKIQQIDIAGF